MTTKNLFKKHGGNNKVKLTHKGFNRIEELAMKHCECTLKQMKEI